MKIVIKMPAFFGDLFEMFPEFKAQLYTGLENTTRVTAQRALMRKVQRDAQDATVDNNGVVADLLECGDGAIGKHLISVSFEK